MIEIDYIPTRRSHCLAALSFTIHFSTKWFRSKRVINLLQHRSKKIPGKVVQSQTTIRRCSTLKEVNPASSQMGKRLPSDTYRYWLVGCMCDSESTTTVGVSPRVRQSLGVHRQHPYMSLGFFVCYITPKLKTFWTWVLWF